MRRASRLARPRSLATMSRASTSSEARAHSRRGCSMIRPTVPDDTPALLEIARGTGVFKPIEIVALRRGPRRLSRPGARQRPPGRHLGARRPAGRLRLLCPGRHDRSHLVSLLDRRREGGPVPRPRRRDAPRRRGGHPSSGRPALPDRDLVAPPLRADPALLSGIKATSRPACSTTSTPKETTSWSSGNVTTRSRPGPEPGPRRLLRGESGVGGVRALSAGVSWGPLPHPGGPAVSPLPRLMEPFPCGGSPCSPVRP